MIRNILTAAALTLCLCNGAQAKDYTIVSPNGRNVVTVSDGITISVSHAGAQTVTVKAGLQLASGETATLKSPKTIYQTEMINAPFYRQKSFTVSYRQMDFPMRGGFGLQVRAYDEGVAYRFYTTNKRETIIADETADFCFPEDGKAWLAYSTNDEKPFATRTNTSSCQPPSRAAT